MKLILLVLPVDLGDGVERLGGVVHLARDAPLAAALGHRLFRQSVELLLHPAARRAVARPAGATAAAHSVPHPLVARGGGETGRMPEGMMSTLWIWHQHKLRRKQKKNIHQKPSTGKSYELVFISYAKNFDSSMALTLPRIQQLLVCFKLRYKL